MGVRAPVRHAARGHGGALLRLVRAASEPPEALRLSDIRLGCSNLAPLPRAQWLAMIIGFSLFELHR